MYKRTNITKSRDFFKKAVTNIRRATLTKQKLLLEQKIGGVLSIYDEKKEKVITMTVTLILVVILICIKVTHFVIIERPLKQCRIVSAYHLTVDTNGAQIDQSWLFEKDDLTYIDIAKTFEQTYFVTDYAGGSGDSGALNELTIAFGETMDGMPDIRITVSENGYIQINGKRAYPLFLNMQARGFTYIFLGCKNYGSFTLKAVTLSRPESL